MMTSTGAVVNPYVQLNSQQKKWYWDYKNEDKLAMQKLLLEEAKLKKRDASGLNAGGTAEKNAQSQI